MRDGLTRHAASDSVARTLTLHVLGPRYAVCRLGPDAAIPEGLLGTRFDSALTGVLASLTAPLADAGISAFVLSTYDTDYLLIQEPDLDKTITVLTEGGHRIRRQPITPSPSS
jgi:hypothetical protein